VRFLILLLPLLFAETSLAREIVWLDEGVDLTGQTAFFVAPVANRTGKTFEVDPTGLVSGALLDELKRAALGLLDRRQSSTDFVVVESSVVDYEPGSASQRWLLPGAGATVCVVRTVLSDGRSGKLLGEIISGDTVGAGGLFSAGADASLPVEVGKEIAQAIITLVKGKKP
jgi:hypothetical protein